MNIDMKQWKSVLVLQEPVSLQLYLSDSQYKMTYVVTYFHLGSIHLCTKQDTLNWLHETNDTNYMYTLDMADRVDNKKKNRSVNWSERDRVILVQRIYEKEDESPRIFFRKFRDSGRDLKGRNDAWDEVSALCNA